MKQTEKGCIQLDQETFIVPLDYGYGLGRKSKASKRNYDFYSYHCTIRQAVAYYLEKKAYEEVANGEQATLTEAMTKLSSLFEKKLSEFMELIDRKGTGQIPKNK